MNIERERIDGVTTYTVFDRLGYAMRVSRDGSAWVAHTYHPTKAIACAYASAATLRDLAAKVLVA